MGSVVVGEAVAGSDVVGIGMVVVVVGEPEEIEIEIDGAGESVGGKVSPLQCAGVIPHQPNFEQHFPLAQIPLPRSPPPLPHVPSGLTMTSSSAAGGVVVVVVVVVVVDCASLRDAINADSNTIIALVANCRVIDLMVSSPLCHMLQIVLLLWLVWGCDRQQQPEPQLLHLLRFMVPHRVNNQYLSVGGWVS